MQTDCSTSDVLPALAAMTLNSSLFTNPQLWVNLTSANAQGCPRGGCMAILKDFPLKMAETSNKLFLYLLHYGDTPSTSNNTPIKS